MTVMRQVSPLPRKVDHQEGEPAYAFLVRTLQHNGSKRIGNSIDRLLGTRESAPSQWDHARIAYLCKADPAAVESATPIFRSKVATVMGQVLSAEHVVSSRRRWCPLCLSERPHHRVWWDIGPVTSCPFHGIELTSSCGCEGRTLTWRSGRLQTCSKGHDLGGIACAAAGADILAFDAYVVGRLRGEGGRRIPVLDASPLGEVLAIAERLGWVSLSGDTTIYAARRTHGTGGLHAEGFRILSGLPGAFEDLLERVSAGKDARSGKGTILRTYGGLYRSIRDLPDHPVGAVLKATLVEHVRANLHVKGGTLVDGRTPLVTGGIVLTSAAAAAGLRYERFVDLLDRLGIMIEVRGQSYEISLADFEPLKARLAGHLGLRQVCAHLGLTTVEVADLVAGGSLDAIASGDGLAGWLFPADAPAELLAKLREKAGKPGPTPRNFVPLPLAASRSGASVAEVIELVFAGIVGIKARWTKRKGIPGLHVDIRSLERHLASSRRDGLTKAVAAKELGLTLAAMDAVVSSSLLASRVVDGIARVPVDEIERFRATWVTLKELRATMGVTAWMPVAKVLAEAAVASPMPEASFWERIYPRESAMQACRSAARAFGTVHWDRTWDAKAMAGALGLCTLMVRQVVEAGLIARREEPRCDGMADWDIDRFRQEHVTLPELAAEFGIISARAVLSLLDKAGVRATCRRPNFYSYLFPRGEASAALRSLAEAGNATRTPMDAGKGSKLTVVEVADRLRTGKNMVLQLVAGGLMEGARSGQRILIPAAELDRFSNKYVLANELALLAGRTSRKGVGASVTKILLRAGIRPRASKPQYVNYVFDRAEAAEFMRRLDLS